jgi:hypothetical protein
MLKIKSDSIVINSNTKKCIEYLSDLNNYQKTKLITGNPIKIIAFLVFKKHTH